MSKLKIGDKKLINAWSFYDWANSVYSLVISTAVFPIYYSGITETFADEKGDVFFLGTNWDPTTLYNYAMAFSFLIVAKKPNRPVFIPKMGIPRS